MANRSFEKLRTDFRTEIEGFLGVMDERSANASGAERKFSNFRTVLFQKNDFARQQRKRDWGTVHGADDDKAERKKERKGVLDHLTRPEIVSRRTLGKRL